MHYFLILISSFITYNTFSDLKANRSLSSLTDAQLSTALGLVADYQLDGNGLDETANYPGTVHGAKPSFNRFGQLNGSLEFDGKDDYIDLGIDFLNYDSITISCWILSMSDPDPMGQDQFFISSGEPNTSTGVFGVWKEGSLLAGHGLIGSSTENIYHASLSPHEWYHIALVFDGVEEIAETYINGNLVHSEIYEVASLTDPADNLVLGKANFSAEYGFHGLIDDLKIYDRKLSPIDVLALFEEGCTDTLSITKLELENDTSLYARSYIVVDTLLLDSAYELYTIAPEVKIDSGYSSVLSNLHVQPGDGCAQIKPSESIHFQHKGIYINNFVTDGILGDSIQEDSLLSWCSFHGFNNIYLYNIGSALSMGLQEELDSFVYEAHHWSPSIAVTFVSAGPGTSFTNIENYHDDYPNIPKGIVSEIEFWNGSMTYNDDFAPWIDKMNSLKFDTVPVDLIVRNPDLIRRFYIGKIKNGGEPPSMTIAENLITNHDEIFLTNYHSDGYNLSNSASENSIRNKLSLLGEAGFNLQQKVNIVILFNVRIDSPAPNIWEYFDESDQDYEFEHAYRSFYQDYLEADDIDYKQYLNLKGYGIYRHSDAKEARGVE